jgi:archaeal preflagellin peptidase FlaK
MAIILLAGQVASAEEYLWLLVAGVLLGLFYLMWRFGLFGGADAKALMVLAILAPKSPHDSSLPVPPALDALANGTLLLVALPVLFVLFNILRGHWSPVMWLGVRMRVVAAQQRHVWPMQVATEDGKVRWRFWQRIGTRLDGEYRALYRAGVDTVWATPKIPLIGALVVGLAVSWLWGNLVIRIATLLIH